MRSSKAIILLGIFLQVLVFSGQAFFNQLFSSRPILMPFHALEMAVIFIFGALVDFAVGFWSVRSQSNTAHPAKSGAMISGSLAAVTARLVGVLIGILIFVLFVFNKLVLQDSLQGPGRSAFLLNMALISFTPICSGGLISFIFGGLGGVLVNSRPRVDGENSIPE